MGAIVFGIFYFPLLVIGTFIAELYADKKGSEGVTSTTSKPEQY